MSIKVTAKAKAFSQENAQVYQFLVSADAVRVWDDVAGYYTTCHALNERAIKRIRALARKEGRS